MTVFVERAPPKVNLTLRVLGRRSDGYHALESLTAFAHDIGDVVTLTVGEPQRVVSQGPFAASIAGENLLAVTLDKVARVAPHLTLGAVMLEKNLPIAAGIGGGSADAAALLRALVRANGMAANRIDWSAIAVAIGADVPVCLASHATLMEGIGERLTPLPEFPRLAAVLVNPRAPVPMDKTAQVFRALRAGPLAEPAPPRTTPLSFAGRAALLAHLHATGNDLTAPALQIVPAVTEVLAALRGSPACELAQMSGGGPTCFGLYPGMAQAAAAAAALARGHPAWWVRASALA